ncbi:hypothetical protein FRC07_014666 [Ceratobasidium sp. 392]|nr:hypothetical protein FRC07_014666 [Ceratobasidium sp. 392]
MSTRAGRPSHLKPIPSRIPSMLAYQGESTAGLTPRTPFSARPSNIDAEDEEEEALEVKVHRSPSAPITPVPPRRNSKPIQTCDSSALKPNRRWRFVTWSAVLALIVIVLLSLYNVDPRHVFMSQASSDKFTAWFENNMEQAHGVTTDIAHPTRTVPAFHLSESGKASQVTGLP